MSDNLTPNFFEMLNYLVWIFQKLFKRSEFFCLGLVFFLKIKLMIL